MRRSPAGVDNYAHEDDAYRYNDVDDHYESASTAPHNAQYDSQSAQQQHHVQQQHAARAASNGASGSGVAAKGGGGSRWSTLQRLRAAALLRRDSFRPSVLANSDARSNYHVAVSRTCVYALVCILCCLLLLLVILPLLVFAAYTCDTDGGQTKPPAEPNVSPDRVGIRLPDALRPTKYWLNINVLPVSEIEPMPLEGNLTALVKCINETSHIWMNMAPNIFLDPRQRLSVTLNGTSRLLPVESQAVHKHNGTLCIVLSSPLVAGDYYMITVHYTAVSDVHRTRTGRYNLRETTPANYTGPDGGRLVALFYDNVTKSSPPQVNTGRTKWLLYLEPGPWSAMQLMPVFDDRWHADLRLSVIHPAGTVVLANAKGVTSIGMPGGGSVTHMDDVGAIYPSQLCLVVGHIGRVGSQNVAAGDRLVPMQLWAIQQSYGPFGFAAVAAGDLLRIFANTAAAPFPWHKLDIVCVPSSWRTLHWAGGLVLADQSSVLYTVIDSAVVRRIDVRLRLAAAVAAQWLPPALAYNATHIEKRVNDGLARYIAYSPLDQFDSGGAVNPQEWLLFSAMIDTATFPHSAYESHLMPLLYSTASMVCGEQSVLAAVRQLVADRLVAPQHFVTALAERCQQIAHGRLNLTALAQFYVACGRPVLNIIERTRTETDAELSVCDRDVRARSVVEITLTTANGSEWCPSELAPTPHNASMPVILQRRDRSDCAVWIALRNDENVARQTVAPLATSLGQTVAVRAYPAIVHYGDEALWDAKLASLRANNDDPTALAIFVDDAFTLARENVSSYERALRAMGRLRADDQSHMMAVSVALRHVAWLHRMLNDTARRTLNEFVLSFIPPYYQSYGLDSNDQRPLDYVRRHLRQAVWHWACTSGVQQCREWANDMMSSLEAACPVGGQSDTAAGASGDDNRPLRAGQLFTQSSRCNGIIGDVRRPVYCSSAAGRSESGTSHWSYLSDTLAYGQRALSAAERANILCGLACATDVQSYSYAMRRFLISDRADVRFVHESELAAFLQCTPSARTVPTALRIMTTPEEMNALKDRVGEAALRKIFVQVGELVNTQDAVKMLVDAGQDDAARAAQSNVQWVRNGGGDRLLDAIRRSTVSSAQAHALL